MKITCTVKFSNDQLHKIEQLGYEIKYYPENSIENDKYINESEILVTYNPFDTLDISKMKNLKYIQTSSIGIDQIPKDKLENRDILICNNKGSYSVPISETIVMNILNIYKNSIKFYNKKLNKKWKMDYSLTELTDKKVGFLGTGTLSSETAKRLKAFSVEVWGVNTDGTLKEYFDKCFSSKDMDKVFKNCDVVVCTMPSTKETIGIINKDKFSLMKDKSIFINVGRGNIVNEKDLVRYIKKFRGVYLDVFENELLSEDSKLWEFDNVIITPHNSWISDKNKERTFNVIYNNLSNYKDGKKLNNIINIDKGY